MLKEPDALVRQAAAFGLGELGGPASARRLEQQLALEEARNDYDGASVVEAISQALGRIEEASARATLMRRLERLAASKPALGDLSTVARALWRKRHPDMLPTVRRSLERIAPVKSKSLQGLQLLLEKSPSELLAWATDPSVPVEQKTGVILLLEEELPEALRPTLPAFISAAHALAETAASDRKGEAADFCDRLLGLLLLHREQLLPSFPQKTRSELYGLTRTLVATTAPICFLGAAVLLQFIGRPEDAELLEAHRPAEPILAKVFDDAARALRGLREP
ncbi:MAG TPA: hypothetical protein VEU33_37435 [Archangium sp.]|nr:hypothetical protein [Archangium sp.]